MKNKKTRRAISKADHVYLINEWWRRIRDEPEKFRREFQVIQELNQAEAAGREPTTGDNDWAYSNQILDERDAAKVRKLKAAARRKSTRALKR